MCIRDRSTNSVSPKIGLKTPQYTSLAEYAPGPVRLFTIDGVEAPLIDTPPPDDQDVLNERMDRLFPDHDRLPDDFPNPDDAAPPDHSFPQEATQRSSDK